MAVIAPPSAAELRTARRAAKRAMHLKRAAPAFWLLSRDVARVGRRDPDAALRELIDHARAHVPFHQVALGEVRDSLESPRLDERRLEDFPILTKNDLRDAFVDLIARDDSGYIGAVEPYVVRTSGSSGITASYLKDVRRDDVFNAWAWHELLSTYDVPPTGELFDIGLHYWTQPIIEVFVTPPRAYVSWVFSGFDAEHEVDEARAIVQTASPTILWGLPSRLTALAHLCREMGISLRPAIVLSSYEQLSPSVRDLLGDAFKCPVVNVYNFSEAGTCGWTCSHGRLHFPRQLTVPEVVDDDGRPVPPGGTGRILITSLKSTLMPLLRYATGDLAKVADGPCPCGGESPSVEALEGRETYNLVSARGREITGYLVMSALDDLRLDAYQIVQEAPGVLRVVIGGDAAVSAEQHHLLAQRVNEIFGEPVAVELDRSGDFVLTPAGKRNPVVSRIR